MMDSIHHQSSERRSMAAPSPRRRGSAQPRLTDDVGFLLSRASGLAVRVTNIALESYGLRVRQYAALVAAGENGGCSQRDIADVLGLDPSQVVALVDELEGVGLVERRPDPRDRRARLVTSTSRGRRVAREAGRAVEQAHEQFLEGMEPSERRVLQDLLRRVSGLTTAR
jgi:MarR family transcriptional regulator, organic hydroperoxide resistance regulator